MNNKVI